MFRPSEGLVINGVGSQYCGLGSDVPVPGQYDSDPEMDLAVFRPSNGGRYIDGQATQYFSLDGDIPAPRNPALAAP